VELTTFLELVRSLSFISHLIYSQTQKGEVRDNQSVLLHSCDGFISLD
jgi:hypothetical protein